MAKPKKILIETLDGKRVRLVPLFKEQVDSIYLSWLKDPKVVEHTDARYSEQTIDSIKEFVAGFDQSDNLIWRIEQKDTKQPIGNLQARLNWLHKTADIGILIGNRDFWGQGMGSEALKNVISFLLEKLEIKKITISTRASNSRMLKTIKGLGFVEEGCLKHQVVHEDGRIDILQFGLFKNDELP